MWSRNAVTDTGAKVPHWGIASSPLLVDDLLVVAASGRLAAYDVATGKPRWFAQTGGGGYSSPHLMTIDGVAQVLLVSGSGATSVAPADGKQLWQHALEAGSRIVQPALTADGDLLMTRRGRGDGGRRRAPHRGRARTGRGWSAQERWTSRGLKPNFNDFVVHKGHAFGFDGSILACIDLEDGERKWKGGRYGNGQLVLLADQDLLLVLSEEGELALVRATPDQFTEIARFPAHRGQDLEPPGAGRRRPAGAQRRGDGRVPSVPRGLLISSARGPFPGLDLLHHGHGSSPPFAGAPIGAFRGKSEHARTSRHGFWPESAYFRAALGSPVGGGAWSVAAGGPSSSVRIGFRPSAQTS